jgi:hypothetical protein
MLTIATRCRLSLHNRDGPGIPNFTLFVHVVVGCNLSLCINIVRGESENVPWTRTTTIPYSSGYIPGHSRSSLHEALFLVVKRVLTLYG